MAKDEKNDTHVYLYDADGSDEEITLEKADLTKLNDKQLLWINVNRRERELIEFVLDKLNLRNISVRGILNVSERPQIEKYENYYRFFIVSAAVGENDQLRQVPIDFLVGKNFVVTIHDGEVEYFDEFRDREKGETQIGELDAESFVASLLDRHIVSYFRALEKIEHEVDQMDEKILRRDLIDEEFIKIMVRLRRDVSKLRRWLMPHRDVIYALARPDFMPVAQSDSGESFQMLGQHFENAVDAIESSRDTVLSLFDLYTTRASHRMNRNMQKLTFITLTVGFMSVIAGTLGMNFREDFFDSPGGFWWAVLAMGGVSLAFGIVAKLIRWI